MRCVVEPAAGGPVDDPSKAQMSWTLMMSRRPESHAVLPGKSEGKECVATAHLVLKLKINACHRCKRV
jgi:hypothetical protein